jgi:hypothetical protein
VPVRVTVTCAPWRTGRRCNRCQRWRNRARVNIRLPNLLARVICDEKCVPCRICDNTDW